VEKFLSRYTDALITINQEDYEASKAFHAKKNYLINGIGVDTSKFVLQPDRDYLRKELSIPDSDLILLSVGELITRKNHETVIDALAKLGDPTIHYVVAGDGELEQMLKSKISDLKMENVHLLGYRRDVNKLYNSSDIFVMPSFQEGLSVALMEAMACGLPLIASSIRGNVDLVDEGKGGYLVDVTDKNQYIDAVKKLTKDEPLRRKMGEYNISKVKNYDINYVIGQLMPIIDETVNG
jgi:glycosyltransferase involved in cell wall biosynthesis